VLKPAKGRIVHVRVNPEHNNHQNTAPAVITAVFGDSAVNLRVLYDGPAERPETRLDWLTSIPLFESEEAYETHKKTVASEFEGLVGCWWPPRVPE
jgi:hypothetical protein